MDSPQPQRFDLRARDRPRSCAPGPAPRGQDSLSLSLSLSRSISPSPSLSLALFLSLFLSNCPTHLSRTGKIAEPYYRYGELEQAWVYLEPSWTFRRTIAAGELGNNPGRVLLRSEGLDTMATVTMNGKLVGQSDNQFHRPVWDVTSAFQPAADNTLEIRFDSPALASSGNHDEYPYPVAGAYITPLQYLLRSMSFLSTAPFCIRFLYCFEH